MTDLFAGLGLTQPRNKALGFYAPMFLLYAVYDGAEDKKAVLAAMDAYLDSEDRHLRCFKDSKKR